MLGNWINQTTTTTGTGNLTLSTVSGFPPASSQFAQDERFQYAILDDATGAPLERGIGYLNASGELVREKPLSVMSGGTYSGVNPPAVSLAAGAKRVICSAGATSTVGAMPWLWSPSSGYKGYGDVHGAGSAGTTPITADRVYIIPFQASVDADVDAVLVRVMTAGGAGTQAKAAIYSIGIDGLPGVKLTESSAVAVDSVGVKAMTFARMRPPPRFFVALLCNGTPTVQSFSTNTNLAWAMGFDGSMVAVAHIHHLGATDLTYPTTWTPVHNTGGTARPQLVMRLAE